LQLGFDFPIGDAPHHGATGAAALAAELSNRFGAPGVPQSFFNSIAVAVGGHHGIFPTDWDGISGPLGNDRWSAARREMLSKLARLFGVAELPPR
jgi:hypothetical protein